MTLRVANGAISCCPMPCKGEEWEPRAAVGRGLHLGPAQDRGGWRGMREGPNPVPYAVFKK